MKTTLPFLLTITLNIFTALTYNIATDYYLVYQNPSEDKGLFGLSVVLHGGSNLNESWVQIGAPARITSKSHPSLVYRCNIGEPCTPLTLAQNSNFQGDGWLGSVMDINQRNNSTVICEPLAKKKYNKKGLGGDLFVIGSCSVLDSSGQINEIITPLDKPDYMYYDQKKRQPYYYGFGQFGFSAKFSSSPEQAVIAFGAPGVLNWIGQPVKHAMIVENVMKIIVSKHRSLSSNSYIGYSVALGRFSHSCDECYAYGAPKSAEFKGTVLILSDKFKLIDLLVGEQMGEYFGGALAAGDINADGFDDLIVGSPTYQKASYSEGCVHIFLGTYKKLSRGQSICGSKQGAHFGTAISYISDLDFDGYGDVAIGAPYEDDGWGAVYIYNGCPTGLATKPSQIISARQVYDHLRGFGYSISNPADIDANGYKDIAIGAYRSGHVVTLRSNPIVTTHQTLTSLNVLNSTSNFVDLKACFHYEAKNFNKTIRINANVAIEDIDVSIERDLPRSMSLEPHKNRCEMLRLAINKNKLTNIHLRLNSTVVNKSSSQHTLIIHKGSNETVNDFCESCVLNNRTHSTVLDFYIPFNLDCRNNTICYANFSTRSSWLDIGKNSIIVGTRKTVVLAINAINTGENAYLAKIEVEIPQYVQLGMIPSICEFDTNKLSCDVGNPLKNTTMKALHQFEFDLEVLNKGIFVDELKITVIARTDSHNLGKGVEVVPLKLKYGGTINITKLMTDSQEMMYDKSSKAVLFNNTYKIENLGPSPAASISARFLVPTSIKNIQNAFLKITPLHLGDTTDNSPLNCTVSNAEGKGSKKTTNYTKLNPPHELNFSNRTFVLDCSQDSVRCTEVICKTGPLAEREFSIVKLQMNVSSNVLVDVLDGKNIIVIATDSSISVEEPTNYILLGNRSIVRTYTVLTGEIGTGYIAMWIILASMMVGFLLLVLLTVLLWKMGFFKRKKKLQLEHEKEMLTHNELYGYPGMTPSVQKNFIKPNGLLENCSDD